MKLDSSLLALDIYYHFIKDFQPTVHGFLQVTSPIRRKRLVWANENTFLVVASDKNKKNIGVMVYKLQSFKGLLTVYRFYYLNSLGKYLLLHWLTRHIDQAKEVSIQLSNEEHIEQWVPDLEIKISLPDSPVGFIGMGRVVSISGLNGLILKEKIPKFQKLSLQHDDISITTKITDPLCEWNCSTFKFSAKEEGEKIVLNVTEISKEKSEEISSWLSIVAISGLVYGTLNPTDIIFRNLGNPTTEEQEILSFMFSPQSPFFGENMF
jgi:hypothetical protein